MAELISENFLDAKQAAEFLGISKASLINWIRLGNLDYILMNNKYFFSPTKLEKLKGKITSGEIKKLRRRANKSNSIEKIIPTEYLENKQDVSLLNAYLKFIDENKISINSALYFTALKLLRENKLIDLNSDNLCNVISDDENLILELDNWKKLVEFKDYDIINQLLALELPVQDDVLGLIYQSFLIEGIKSKTGSYYTPSEIINSILTDLEVKENSKILDPCCGTGQFLLKAAEIVKNPSSLYGFDNDETSIKIARINLKIKFKDQKFVPKIFYIDTIFNPLDDKEIKDSEFDFIITNPPWGLHFSPTEVEMLKEMYPEITSFESFSLFLKRSIDLLKTGGKLSFILPEAITNVRTHKDIRNYIVKHTSIKNIFLLGKVFSKVFSNVIRLDLQKGVSVDTSLNVYDNDNVFNINSLRFNKNKNLEFDIHLNNVDEDIINKIYSFPHRTLKNNASWALGIVTGNNEKYISTDYKEEYEEIICGKDLKEFVISPLSQYIDFQPEEIQQIAPINLYRCKYKLVYKFINNRLLFAIDDKRRLTLNSANILIPQFDDYSLYIIAALFNSEIFRWIHQKKFNSIKILRNHLEQLPLPDFVSEEKTKIEESVKKDKSVDKINSFLYKYFNLPDNEIEYIKSSIK